MRTLSGVGKRYRRNGTWVLDNIDLRLPPGVLVRVAGGNGTGKSTLLRLIAGVGSPSRGRITGRPVTGFVPERFPPALPFAALDYLAHLGRVHGLGTPEARSRGERLLDRLGAAEFARTPLRELSKGTVQKVAVAQALLPRPGLLVLDEAWAGLDTAARELLDAEVDARLSAGSSVVFVDHDPARLADRPVVVHHLEQGRLVPVPAPASVPIGGVGTGPAGGVGIELTGLPVAGPGQAEQVALWLGLVPTWVVSAGADLLRLGVPADAVDDVLRRALAVGPQVHVLRVGPVDGTGERDLR